MEVLGMLNELEEMLETANSFFGKKVSIDKVRALELITDIRIGLPDDFKQAEWISQERQRIIFDAEDDAKEIIEKAKLEAEKLVEQSSITQAAYKRADEIVEKAQEDARKLRNGAIYYSQDLLKEVAKDMTDIAEKVMKNYDELETMVIKQKEEEVEE